MLGNPRPRGSGAPAGSGRGGCRRAPCKRRRACAARAMILEPQSCMSARPRSSRPTMSSTPNRAAQVEPRWCGISPSAAAPPKANGGSAVSDSGRHRLRDLHARSRRLRHQDWNSGAQRIATQQQRWSALRLLLHRRGTAARRARARPACGHVLAEGWRGTKAEHCHRRAATSTLVAQAGDITERREAQLARAQEQLAQSQENGGAS